MVTEEEILEELNNKDFSPSAGADPDEFIDQLKIDDDIELESILYSDDDDGKTVDLSQLKEEMLEEEAEERRQ